VVLVDVVSGDMAEEIGTVVDGQVTDTSIPMAETGSIGAIRSGGGSSTILGIMDHTLSHIT
jgi:hypothetical protein